MQPPKEPAENADYRNDLLGLAKQPCVQAALMQACRDDILFFINSFVIQTNPKHFGTEVGPFVTWDFQEEALLATVHRLFVDQDDMLWEKSREMGATWMALILALWLCLFHPNKRVLCVSHSEQAVDRAGDEGTLFAKMDFILENLPPWMTKGVKATKLNYTFPGRSSISGYASTKRSGVGDRVTMVLLDEFSKQEQAHEILGQTADTGPRLFIGTHYGVGTTFYNLTRRPDMRKIVFHWTQHPEKKLGLYKSGVGKFGYEVLDNGYEYPVDFEFHLKGEPTGGPYPGVRSPRYDKEQARRTRREMAMHWDIDPQGSDAQVFDGLLIRQLVQEYAEPHWWEGDINCDPDTGEPLELVSMPGGPLRLWLTLAMGNVPPPAPYTIGGDISTGSGATNSILSIGNAKTGERVGEYATCKWNPDQLAPRATALGRLFKDERGMAALLGWETPGPGAAFGKRVIELGYSNCYYREAHPTLAGGKVSEVPGWHCSNETKRLLLTEYMAALYGRRFINRCALALGECLDFKYDESGNPVHGGEKSPNDPTGARENHGDRVIADGICNKLMKLTAPGQMRAKGVEEIKRGSLAWRRQRRHDEMRHMEEEYA